MKTSLITLFVLSSIIAVKAQHKPLTFNMAIRAENTTQKELYKRGKFWYEEVFKCTNKKLTLDNPDQGVITGKGTFEYEPNVAIWSAKTKGSVEYQVTLRFKDDRYEYEITNFKHKGSGISFGLLTQAETCNKEVIEGASADWKNEVWKDIKSQADANTKAIIKSLIAEISEL